MRCVAGEGPLLDLLAQNKAASVLIKSKELAGLFELDYHLKEVNRIFDRVFGVS
jgi:hypothetical protein